MNGTWHFINRLFLFTTNALRFSSCNALKFHVNFVCTSVFMEHKWCYYWYVFIVFSVGVYSILSDVYTHDAGLGPVLEVPRRARRLRATVGTRLSLSLAWLPVPDQTRADSLRNNYTLCTRLYSNIVLTTNTIVSNWVAVNSNWKTCDTVQWFHWNFELFKSIFAVFRIRNLLRFYESRQRICFIVICLHSMSSLCKAL